MRSSCFCSTLSTLFVIVVNILFVKGAVFSRCKSCSSAEECNRIPENCLWGEIINACRRRVCAKGPGQLCGGPSQILGICADGLYCRSHDNRCHGCTLKQLICSASPFR